MVLGYFIGNCLSTALCSPKEFDASLEVPRNESCEITRTVHIESNSEGDLKAGTD